MIALRNHRPILLPLAATLAAAAALGTAASAHAENPIVKLVSVANGKCLQPINGSLFRGDAIVQQTCNGTTAQQWTVTPVASTKVHLVNRLSGLCLDARGGAANGTPIQQWPCNTITNENWNFGITNDLLGSRVSNTSSHCIATPGDQDGLLMELRFCDGTITQRWNRPPWLRTTARRSSRGATPPDDRPSQRSSGNSTR